MYVCSMILKQKAKSVTCLKKKKKGVLFVILLGL